MATTSMTKAKGLATFSNYLSEVPEGSLLEAKNVIIDRDGVIEPRRGIKVLGETLDIPKQLITFKNTVLVHSKDAIQFSDNNDPATFTTFKGKHDFSPLSVDTLNNTITINLHGLSENDSVVFYNTGGTLPSGITAGQTYYVKNPTQNKFQISTSTLGLIQVLGTQGTGVHTINYDYIFDELNQGLRIKYIELNGNLFVTTANGIKKISNTTEYSVTDAGGIKALDLTLSLDLSTTVGFLTDTFETSYRVVWGTRDINDNLVLGVPSYRQTIQNFTGASRDVFISFSVPEGVTSDYFYQIYRTNVAVEGGSGDEMKLVYESPYTGGDTITVLDVQPEDIRDSGTPLYSNEFSGEGAFQTNNPPPIAKDVSIYRNTAFYANTKTTHKTKVTLVGMDGLTPEPMVSTVTDAGGGNATVTTVSDHSLSNGDKVLLNGCGDLNGKYIVSGVTNNSFNIVADYTDFNPTPKDQPIVYSAYFKTEKNTAINEYFFVGSPEVSSVVYKSKPAINPGSYFLLNSYDALIKYCFWYDTTGTDIAPTLSLVEGQNRAFVRIDLSNLGVFNLLPATINITTNEISLTSHGFADDHQVKLNTSDVFPTVTGTPLDTTTTYYIDVIDSNKFKLSRTPVSSPTYVDFTSQGSGNFIINNPYWVNASRVAKATAQVLVDTGDFKATESGITDLIFTTNNGPAASTGYPTAQNGSTGLEGVSSISVTFYGTGEDISKLFVRKSGLLSPAAQIQDTARSLTKVINLNTNDGVYAYYTSEASSLPGEFELESRTRDDIAFSVSAVQLKKLQNIDITAPMFNPDIRTPVMSISEVNPNKIFFSKTQQPESVPLVNSITIGPKDKAILRIIGLRDSLFILKEEGIYRLTGDNSSNFSVSLFDNSATITAPDSACVLNNQIYCLTTQGVVSINEAGVGVVSRPIENKFLNITSPAFVNYATQTFAVSYESDRSYIIFVPKTPNDTSATEAFRYNTFTQSWTTWEKSSTCAVVETSKNRLYLGAADIPAVEIERKALTSRDYADRQYNRNINTYDSGYIYMDNTADIEPGDMITQTQYVTLAQCNSLLSKLEQDPLLDIIYQPINPGDDLKGWLDGLYAELNSKDLSRITKTFDPMVAFDDLADKIVINNHGFVDNDIVQFSGDPIVGINSGEDYVVINASTNDFQLTTSFGGAPITLASQSAGSSVISNNYFVNENNFDTIQIEYNNNIYRMNTSAGLFFTDYKQSVGSIYYDLLVTKVEQNQTRILVRNISPFFVGPAIHYKAIKSSIIWNYNDFQNPSLSKHVREGVTIIESTSLSGATVGYATDLSGNFEDTVFTLDGDGGFGDSVFGNVAFGGTGIAVPIRTLIPRQKQRCRYIKARFKHNDAFYKFAILGIAYTYETTSERAWR